MVFLVLFCLGSETISQIDIKEWFLMVFIQNDFLLVKTY